MRTTKISLLIGALSCAPGVAYAQTQTAPAAATAQPQVSEGDIVVTASRREQRVQDVPIALQVFTGESLERAGIKDLRRLTTEIPGAVQFADNGPTTVTYHLRGSQVTGLSGDAAVGYYIDDVPFGIPNTQNNPPLRFFDLARAEVLRGPQGTLYGQGALGGTIRVFSADPDLTRMGMKTELTVSVPDGGEVGYSANGAVNLPLITDKLGVRLVASREFVGGFSQSPSFPEEKNINDARSTTLRAKVLIVPTDNLRINLAAWRLQSRQDFSNQKVDVNSDWLAPTGGLRPYQVSKTSVFSANMELDLGKVKVTSITSHIDYDADWLGVLNLGRILEYRNAWKLDKHITQEVRINSQGMGAFNFVVGGLYSDQAVNKLTAITGISRSNLKIGAESYALFGEVSYDLFDGRLTPLVGLRYYRDHRTGADSFVSAGKPGFMAYDRTYKHVSPRFNLTFHVTPDVMIYANVANGFRSGTFQSAAAVANLANVGIQAQTFLDEDSVWSYEGGVKGSIFDRSLTFDLTAYQTAYKNLAVLGSFSGVVGLAEVGDARLRGLEFSLTYRTPIEGLSLQASGSVIDHKFTRLIPGSPVRNPARLPYTPSNNFFVSAAYEKPVNDTDTVYFNASYGHRARAYSLSSDLPSGALDDVSATLGLRTGPLDVSVFVRNLLNERGPTQFLQVGQAYAEYPRQIGVTLRGDF